MGAEEGTDVRGIRKTESTTDWVLAGRKRGTHRTPGASEPGGRKDIAMLLRKINGPGGGTEFRGKMMNRVLYTKM